MNLKRGPYRNSVKDWETKLEAGRKQIEPWGDGDHFEGKELRVPAYILECATQTCIPGAKCTGYPPISSYCPHMTAVPETSPLTHPAGLCASGASCYQRGSLQASKGEVIRMQGGSSTQQGTPQMSHEVQARHLLAICTRGLIPAPFHR